MKFFLRSLFCQNWFWAIILDNFEPLPMHILQWCKHIREATFFVDIYLLYDINLNRLLHIHYFKTCLNHNNKTFHWFQKSVFHIFYNIHLLHLLTSHKQTFVMLLCIARCLTTLGPYYILFLLHEVIIITHNYIHNFQK